MLLYENKKVINFLDKTLDLNYNRMPLTLNLKMNHAIYVYRESNHPPLILENIPLAINRSLNEILSTKTSFDEAAKVSHIKGLDVLWL